MAYAPGSIVTRTAQFIDSSGALVDPDSIVVDVIDDLGVTVANDIPATRISLGTYEFSYTLPVDAADGVWKFFWTGTFGTKFAYGEDEFEVSATGVVVNTGIGLLASRLRTRLAEVSLLAASEQGSDTMFKDSEITDILLTTGNDLDKATIEGWSRKCAKLSRLIDIAESGSERELSQRFKQAKSMLDWWSKTVSEATVAASKGVYGPVAGKVASLRECSSSGALQTPFSGYSEHIREYPLKRLIIPAILTGSYSA